MFTRLLIRKRRAFRHSPVAVATLRAQLALPGLGEIETVAVYDLFDCPEKGLETAISRVFADPVSDRVIETLPEAERQLVIEPLPGQFDQRADSAEQCLRLIDPAFARTTVRTAVAWLIHGELDAAEYARLKTFLINPIETREKDLSVKTLPPPVLPEDVPRYRQFLAFDAQALAKWHEKEKLAMRLADLRLVQKHFQALDRAPSETEIRVLDTYWSDHCRHTTFSTPLDGLRFPDSPLGEAIAADYRDFLGKRRRVYGAAADARPLTLMELATIDAKYLRKTGKLEDVEFSAEVNACSVFVTVTENQEKREWLLQFKNETHNHPTEIEPFGGAATCIGGAIRDPLSGRAYVYQALRLSGGADPREAIAATLPGKLPQRVIAERAAAGASAYGNQIGLATGQVVELYHRGYKAKHLEVGAVLAATPADHLRRAQPQPGDIVLLLGGATGRDGCGGATGSSRAHDDRSLGTSAAEVQKGNPPEERKLQRLFRQKAFARMIKRCNDCGAGGISVAIGELADGIAIDLDAVPVKYQGLNGTELAISESQERMAIVVDAADEGEAQCLADAENLTATRVGVITDDATLTMRWRGEIIVSLERALLDSDGAARRQEEVRVPAAPLAPSPPAREDWKSALKAQLQTLAMADRHGLGDRFDFSVGAGCVLLPYGGRYHETAAEGCVCLLPTETASETASVLTYGFNPDLSAQSPYHGGMLAVAEASARLIACGGDLRRAHFSLQEYFPSPGGDAERWGLPVAALLGAHHALSAIGRAAIGGKDSMSGSFKDLDVPPTLIAFAVTTVEKTQALSPEFKSGGEHLYWLRCPQDTLGRPDFAALLANNDAIVRWNRDGLLCSARGVRHGGVLQAIYEAARGNRVGVRIARLADAFSAEYGGFLLSSRQTLPPNARLVELGTTIADPVLDIAAESIPLAELLPLSASLEEIYPRDGPSSATTRRIAPSDAAPVARRATGFGKPRVCLPVFPGSNSELDTGRAFIRAGGSVRECLIRNRGQEDIRQSLDALSKTLDESQIFVLCGGFSGGDEPDGAGKFIANILASPALAEAIARLLARDGLILGICNGFQALLKSGLLPRGKRRLPQAGDATLTQNAIRRHIARIVTTTIVNNRSPWFSDFAVGECHDLAVSHGEGRFYADERMLATLIANGQIAAQYADPESGTPSMKAAHNPNGSVCAIEAISSPCGRILGKMGHSERYQSGIYRNHPNFRAQDIFRAGVRAFK